MTAVFVTATGTDIGKTFVTAGLVRSLRARGRSVNALKPVASGFDRRHAAESDPGLLIAALGRDIDDDALDRASRWRFAAALSPDMAARREGRGVDFAALLDFCRKTAQPEMDALLIEGVGGIMAPLDERHTVLDWMAALGLPLLVVAGSYLGTISHTLSAVEVLRWRGLNVLALIINETPGSTVDLRETVETISRFAHGIEIVALRRWANASPPPELDRLAARLWP
ncbi:MAG TPA: dethiobiotin synthase [Stellaceae bacterium]|jgi:dethiobiotin synthetase|nr:dethiobiotin synthase [Stellaceae bacterium]